MKKGLLGLAPLAIVAIAGLFALGGNLGAPETILRIASGSENKPLEPIIQKWAGRNNTTVEMTYIGSVDISREIEAGTGTVFDAVWPAHSIWVELGDQNKTTSGCQSILRSPVVLGLRQPIARDLGWIGRDDITIQDIASQASDGAFRLAMTSATQSNSGASAYIGFLYALAGNPDVLGMDDLTNPQVLDATRDLLAQVDRSSGSSGWLKDALVANPQAYDAMINYEAMVLEANEALVAQGQDPLYLIYPANGISVADSPLCMIDKGDVQKAEAFAALQAHLLSPDTQDEIIRKGRRAGLIGVSAETSAPIWNSAWGVDPARSIAPVPTPSADVIREALRLFQTELRKPSLTVWVLDVSGSMQGEPLAQLKSAMTLLLDPQSASLNLLQPSARDITIVIPFSDVTSDPAMVEGSDPQELNKLLAQIRTLQAGGGTDLYVALGAALEAMKPYSDNGTLADYLPAIVAMTDGASDTENRRALFGYMNGLPYGRDVPLHAIAFGDADEGQLKELGQASIGRLFDGREDLAAALRQAKGYN